MHVKDVMRPDVTSVTPGTSLREVARILAENAISGVPVVANGGSVVGVVSEADVLMKEREPGAPHGGLLGWLTAPYDAELDAKLAARTAEDAMTAPAVTIESGAPLAKAAALMVDLGINRLPVVDGGELVGIVARADLVRAFTRADAEIEREIRDDLIRKRFWIDPSAVVLRVVDGEVTLRGEVERRSLAELLASYVERVVGVVAVRSELTWREDDRP
jgi:CBS domain-containing protein